MPRATKSRVVRLRERIACPVCSHRLGDPVRVRDDSTGQVEDVVVLMGLMRRVLEPPDIMLQALATSQAQIKPAPRATKGRRVARRDAIFCPACGHRFGDPVPREGDDSSQITDGVLLVSIMAGALERFDAALQQGELPPGVPVPRALLPEGYVPPEGMVINESVPVVIIAPEEEQSVDDILEALQRGVSQPGGVSNGDS
jgi:DNA-directed RNA polymerase subunit RPC12/RpoP